MKLTLFERDQRKLDVELAKVPRVALALCPELTGT